LKTLREGTPPTEIGNPASKDLRDAALPAPDYAERIKRFLE